MCGASCSPVVDLLASYDLNGQLTALDDLIAQGADKRMVLRMLVLASITSGGIKSKLLENLKKEVLQVRHARFFHITRLGISL
jgi:hypothetical protein